MRIKGADFRALFNATFCSGEIMIQLAAPDSLFQNLLGFQPDCSENRRLSRFTIICSVSEGTLLYSTLTKELLLLSPEEYTNLLSDNTLFHKWMTVSESRNEFDLRNQLFSILAEKQRNLSPHKYTILPTTGCNARCYYCFEKGRRNSTMTDTVADKTVAFISQNYHNNQTPVILRWFGGEPLINSNIIQRICSNLSVLHIPFSSQIVSNGYLFDSAMVEKAKNEWRTKSVQITLDGTREQYNLIKNYYTGGDPFSVVLSNIELLLKKDISVSLRLNLSHNNYEDLCLLIEELNEKFKGFSNLSVYANPLFEKMGEASESRSENERELLYKQLYLLHQRLLDYGLGHIPSLPHSVPLNQCMADSGTSVLISPNGKLGLCDMYSDSEFFGSLESNQYDKEMLQSWKERRTFPECGKCPLSPECIRLRKCLEYSFCSESERQYRILEIKEAMLQTYRLNLNSPQKR